MGGSEAEGEETEGDVLDALDVLDDLWRVLR
jgi:hypothetical protein